MKKTLFTSLRVAFTFFAIAISSSFSKAQTEQCLSGILHDRLMSTDATYAATMTANENILQGIIADIESGARALPTSFRIPVVVHIIHKGEAVGVGTNISDAQVYSAIRTLNEAYRKKTGTEFYGNGMDTGLEFCLAQKDAAGNPSTGILRVNGSGTSDYATNGITTSGTTNETTIKNLSKWLNTKYYNIWVVAEIDGNNGGAGVQGFAYFPGASALYDGAVMMYNCFGYDPTGVYGYNLKSYTNRNKTLIHEMGHALNLYHTFEGDGTGATCPTNTNCNTQGDRCCDIPPHMRSNSTCIADGTANSCLAGTFASDYQHNYMDYSADVCTNMFTANQSTRMNATLATGGPRASLATATNLTNCGCSIPIVLFSANPVNPCLGIPVQFTDESLNFPTSWAWSFPGGAVPASSTVQNPTATYSSAGSYNVTLQATTAAGNTGTLTKTAYINPIASAALPFSENFEGATFPPTGWTRVSGDAPSVAWGTDGIHQWERRPAAGNAGSTAGSAAMNLFNYNLVGPPIDNLIVKPVSLVGVSTSQMTFKVSHKNYPSASNYDSLKVFVSTDCGNSFGSAVYSKSGTTLATNGSASATFTPAVAADWRTETVSLNSYVGQIIIVKFVTYSNYGNNVYIDDVNITGTSSGPVATVVIASNDADNTFCAGTSVTFTATPTNGGTTPVYQWQVNGVNVGTNSPTYNTSTLTNGQIVTCIMTSNLSGVVGSPATSNAITNTVNPIPSTPAPSSNTPVCVGGSILLSTATVSGATYAWTGPSGYTSAVQNPTRSAATVAMSGTYNVTVTVNGCTSPMGSTIVAVNTVPTTPAVITNSPVCSGSTITLSTSAVSGATYAWTGPSAYTSSVQNPTIAGATAAMAGTYSLTITVGGCNSPAGTGAVVVNTSPATPAPSSNSPVCTGSTINLTTSTVAGATYAWTGPSAFTSALQNPTRTGATAAMAGTYSVTVTVAGCTSAAGTTAVVVNTAPSTPTAGSNTPVCSGTTINLTTPTVAGATYAWTGPATFTSTLQNPTRAAATAAMAGTYSVTVTVGGCTSAAGTTVVAVNTTPATPSPMINGSATPAAICAGGTITLTTATVTGATYAWTGPNSYTAAVRNPPALTSVTTAMGGTYSLTVTVGGCTSLAGTASIIVNPIPTTPTAGSNSPVCTGSTISLTTPTVAGATYAWSGPSAFTSTSQNPNRTGATVGMAGTYSVTVTVGGCASAAGTTVVTVNSSVTPSNVIALTTGSNPTCEGSNLTFTSTPAGGGATPTYQWQVNGSNVAGATSNTFTTTTLTNGQIVTCILTSSSSCASPATATSNAITMTVNAIPSTPTAGSNTPVCSGNAINLTTATVAGASYAWTGPNTFTSTSQNPSTAPSTAAMAGTYSVTVTVAGCTSATGTTAVVVNTSVTPSVSAGATPSGAICSGANVSFSATPTNGGAAPSYQWQVNGSNAGTGATFNTSSLANGDVVTCILTSNATCASPLTASSSGITMMVNATVTPAVTTSITSGSNPMCSGSSVTLTAAETNGGASPSYQWQVNGSNAGTGISYSSSSLANGDVVTCILTSSSACASPTTATSTGLMMVVDPITTPAISIAASNTIICAGDSVVFNATPTNGGTSPAYQWQVNGSNTGTGASYTNYGLVDADIVTCILTTSDPCPTSATANSNSVTINVNPIPSTPTISQVGLSLTSSSATGNQWYLNGVIIPGATSQNYTATANGNYTVVVITSGCTSPESAPTAIINVGIDESINPHLLNVYPNPNDGNFTVSFLSNEKDSYTIELTNALGQSVYKEEMKDFTGKYSKQLSVESFGKGIYMINLTNSNHETVKKIVVY